MKIVFRRAGWLIPFCSLLLAGCLQPRNKAVVKNNPYRASITKDLMGDWLTTYRALPEATDADKATKRARRNEIMNEFIWLADDAYYRWEPKFYASGASLATFFDFASLGLTGAASVGNSPQVFGAMATGIQGANATINKNYFDQQSRSVIVQKMRQLRDAAMVRIVDGEKREVADYSLDQGIVEIQNYYYSGTVTAALQGLASSTAAQHEDDKAALDSLRTGAQKPQVEEKEPKQPPAPPEPPKKKIRVIR